MSLPQQAKTLAICLAFSSFHVKRVKHKRPWHYQAQAIPFLRVNLVIFTKGREWKPESFSSLSSSVTCEFVHAFYLCHLLFENKGNRLLGAPEMLACICIICPSSQISKKVTQKRKSGARVIVGMLDHGTDFRMHLPSSVSVASSV